MLLIVMAALFIGFCTSLRYIVVMSALRQRYSELSEATPWAGFIGLAACTVGLVIMAMYV